MQAIQTKFFGPTNTRGARYKATCEAGSLTLPMDYAINSEDNHVRVASALIAKLGWFHDINRGDTYGAWHYGGTADGYVFVCAVSYATVTDPSICGDCPKLRTTTGTHCAACGETWPCSDSTRRDISPVIVRTHRPVTA
jgi:hypothetical protein